MLARPRPRRGSTEKNRRTAASIERKTICLLGTALRVLLRKHAAKSIIDAELQYVDLLLDAELGRAEIRIGKCHFLRAKTLRRGVTRSSTVTVQPDSAANKRKDHRTNSD
jgi:hypothetical protein